MAEAAGHRFGQLIGAYCENAIVPLLQEFADRHDLYLDRKGLRPARTGQKVKWIDTYGSAHDLDFVLERGGTDDTIGNPVAFIESAWRRYTKHSRNKAQEIQGAVLPIARRHRYSAPFLGMFLIGEYTEGALASLRKSNFSVLYFPYRTVIDAFASADVDAAFTEATPDKLFAQKLRRWKATSQDKKVSVWAKLLEFNRTEVMRFMADLERSVERQVKSVRVIPLHGTAIECASVEEAIEFVRCYAERRGAGPLVKYDVQLRYDNGDRVDAEFQAKDRATDFLETFLPGKWKLITDDIVPSPDLIANDDDANGDHAAPDDAT